MKEKIGIIGLGIIGGSLALAFRDKHDVVGYDTDAATVERAREKGIAIAPVSAMKDRTVIFVCVPVSRVESELKNVYDTVGDKPVITDVASVKALFAGAKGRYVGSHPMAGAATGGIRAAKAHMFQNAYWCITGKGKDAEFVAELVKQIGAIPVFMTADEHDRAVAMFSHVPHAIAYSLVAATDGAAPIAGSGFLDTTRIAQSDENFWAQVFLKNRQNVLDGIAQFKTELEKVEDMLKKSDEKALTNYLASSRQKRVALNRVDLGGEQLYVDLEDKVGEFERITGAIARAGVNVKNMSLVPGREGAGAVRLEFDSASERKRAAQALGMKD